MVQSNLFKAAYNAWKQKNSEQLNPLTYRRYTNIAEKYLLPYFADTGMSDITDTLVSDFMQKKEEEGTSAATINMSVRVLGKVLEEAGLEPVHVKLVKTDTNKNQKNDTVVMRKEDVKVLELYLYTSQSPLSIGIFLSLKMGMNLGEICGLQWQDVNLESAIANVSHMVQRVPNKEADGPKTKLVRVPLNEARCRKIPIPSSVLDLLLKEEYKTGFVLLEGESSMPDPRTVQWRFARLMKMLKMLEYNYNALRTTFAVRCLEAGMDIESLSRLLGHSSVNITAERYQRFLEKENMDINQMKRFME